MQTQAEAEEKAELERIQNESAQYSYGSNIEDNINDGAIQREETRDGTKVRNCLNNIILIDLIGFLDEVT